MTVKSLSTLTVSAKPGAAKMGRPKVPWEPIAEEFYRRLTACESAPTLEEECRYLAEWAAHQGLKPATKTKESTPISHPAIRRRLIKRISGRADKYKSMRAEALAKSRTSVHAA